MTAARRGGLACLALGALLAGPAAGSLEAQDPAPPPALAPADPLDELLVELRIGRLMAATVFALSDGAEILVPVGALLRLGEVEHAVDADGRVRAVFYPGARVVTIDPVAGLASVDGAPWPLPEGAIARSGGSTYAATSVLEALLGLSIRTDPTQLTVTVRDPEALPVGQRLEREARWRNLIGGRDGGSSAELLDLERSRFGGAVVDWRLSSTMNDPSESTAYAVGLGARVFEGGVQVSARSVGPASQGRHRIDATYQRVFHDTGWLTQMRLADGFTTGPRYRSLRGFSLTNAPFVRRSFFDVDAFQGRVGPGWDVELRQSGRTVDVSRADEQGAFALDIPLRYGENVIQVVAFGPHGEVVTTERLVLLGMDRLSAGAFEWGLSGGACRDSRCDLTGNLDLRYGLSERWTARAGMESFTRDSLPSLAQPYLGVTGSVLPSLQLSAEAVHRGFLRGGLTFAPSPRFRARLVHTAFSSDVDAPVLNDGSRRGTTESDVLVRPLSSRSRWLVRASVLRQDLDFGVLSRMQASSTFRAGPANIEMGIRREMGDLGAGARWMRDFQHGSVTGLVPLPGGHRVWARGEMELLEGASVERMRAELAYQITRATRLELGGGWRRGVGSDLTITFSADLAQLRSLTQLAAPAGFPARVTQVSQGAMHWDESVGRVGFTGRPGLERGGVSGYVFVDENGNGIRDPEETGLDGVRVVIGSRTVRTDEDGRHHAWDLVPFEPVDVWADSASIADPSLVPTRGQVRVVVPPSSFGRVDIPLARARELVGRVVRVTPDGEVPVPYAALELVDVETGQARAVRAFSDGEIYEIGVKPGRYELRLSAGTPGMVGLEPERAAYPVEIPVRADAPSPEPVVVRLVPEPIDGQGS
jgi:hypothetical protein